MTPHKPAGLLLILSTTLLFPLACNHAGSADQATATSETAADTGAKSEAKSGSKSAANNTAVDYFNDTSSGLKTGGIQMVAINTPKGTFNVWTKRIGNNPKIKLLLLNGGPGATHEYFECLESFLPAEGIEFIYYDQLGCGNSDNPKDTSMWDLSRYVEEVEQVRQALHLDKDNFYLLGHSWGGILAAQYALKYQQHLKGLIISNMMMSCPAYGKYAEDVLAKQFDPKVLARIRELEAKKQFDNPEYMGLLLPNFYAKHILRRPIDQWPEPVNRSLGKLNKSLYVTMQGPSEFGISGKLAKWDITAQLPSLSVPALTIGGQFDTMDPRHMQWVSTRVQNGSYLYCPNGSHMSMYDDQQTYMKGLIKFIKAVNAGQNKISL
jgi:proline iminopeptidase